MAIFAFGSQSTAGVSTVIQDGSVLVWNATKGVFVPVPPNQQNQQPGTAAPGQTIDAATLWYLSTMA